MRKVTYTADPVNGFRAKVELIPPPGSGAEPESPSLVPPVAPVTENQNDYAPPSVPNVPGAEYNVGNFDYSNSHYTHENDDDEKPSDFGTYGNENHQELNKEDYAIPEPPDLDEIREMFKNAKSSDFPREDGDFETKSDIFERLRNQEQDETLFENIPPFPPLPELSINEFSSNVEFEEPDTEPDTDGDDE